MNSLLLSRLLIPCCLNYSYLVLPVEHKLSVSSNVQPLQTEATSLVETGNTLFQSGHYDDAIKNYYYASELYLQIGDSLQVGHTFLLIGRVYTKLEQYSEAIRFYRQALRFLKELPDWNEAAQTLEFDVLSSLGTIYATLTQYTNAIESYEYSLGILNQTGNDTERGFILNNLGIAYYELGQYSIALEYYQQALAEYRKLRNLDREGDTFNNIANLYLQLGQYQSSLELYQQALIRFQDADDLRNQGAVLSNIGRVYLLLNDPLKALDYYQQSLSIRLAENDQIGAGYVFNNLGEVYTILGQYSQASRALEQALQISRAIGLRQVEGKVLEDFGTTYKQLQQPSQALDFYQQALAIAREVGSRKNEASILSHIAALFESQQPELAIAFYKQFVNVTEIIREDLQSFSPEEQLSYTATIEERYRRLADLLLQQDRILEAQQVLDLLKVQELDSYLRGIRGSDQTAQGVDLLPAEQDIVDSYFVLLDQAIPVGRELTALRQISPAERTETQAQRIAELVAQQQRITQLFAAFVRREDVVAWVNQLSRTAREQNLDLSTLRNLSGTLQDLRTQLNQTVVLLYPLILEDRLELVLVTPDSPPINRTVDVSRIDLNRAIEAFRRVLEDPSADAVPAAQQLYQWLIQPIQADLDRADADILIAAPDAQLRYVPLAALHDGSQWLTQRYLINYITAASLTNFTQADHTPTRVLAGAFAEGSFDVRVGDRTYTFDGLTFADDEVNEVATLIPDTKTLFDGNFSAAATIPSMDDYTIIHFATHAAFFPGRPPSDSFILFGNGDRVTLQQVEHEWFLTNVDLIVLSACQTGLGGSFGGGEEILGFGYLMQNAGARAAIASLWEVSDGGTQALMTAFYNALQHPNITKAEALQQAQIALITGHYSMSDNNTRSPLGWGERDGGDRPAIAVDTLSHPYYWAPFILIGNGL